MWCGLMFAVDLEGTLKGPVSDREVRLRLGWASTVERSSDTYPRTVQYSVTLTLWAGLSSALPASQSQSDKADCLLGDLY